jgi:hypothetical protein
MLSPVCLPVPSPLSDKQQDIRRTDEWNKFYPNRLSVTAPPTTFEADRSKQHAKVVDDRRSTMVMVIGDGEVTVTGGIGS